MKCKVCDVKQTPLIALTLILTVRRYGGLSAQAFAVEAALYVARYGKGTELFKAKQRK